MSSMKYKTTMWWYQVVAQSSSYPRCCDVEDAKEMSSNKLKMNEKIKENKLKLNKKRWNEIS